MEKQSGKGRLLTGLLTVLCAVAVVFALQAPPVSEHGSSVAPLASASSAAAVSENPEGNLEQPAREVSADGTVVIQGEYEPDVVIAHIGQGNDATVLDDALSHVALLDTAAVSITDADVQAGYVALPLAAGASVADAVAALDDVEGVVGAQPNYIYHLLDDRVDETEGAKLIAASASGNMLTGTSLLDALADVNDPYAKQGASGTYNWHLKSICAYEAWETAQGESPAASTQLVTVAVLDTGYDLDHEDLTDGAESGIGGNVVAAYDATANEDEHYDSGVADIDGHGTHVVGIVAAIANNEKGVAGVSHNANVLPIQVFHSYTDNNGEEKHGASSLSVKAAFDYICEHAEEYNIHVANMSLGAKQAALADDDKLLISAADEAWAKGVLTVCASGNGARSGAYRVFPGDYLNHGMNVIALSSDRKRADYSNYNLDEIETYKDISAPGNSVYSTVDSSVDDDYVAGAKYGAKSGTSMATPIVSAVAALVWSASPQLGPGDVIDILHSTALDLTPENSGENTKAGFDQYTGYGEVDAKAAVDRASAYLMGDSTALVGGSLTLSPTGEAPTGAWTWSSSDNAIATVAGGVVTGVGGGTATITATSGDVSITKTITVFDISYALAEDGVAVEDLVKVDEVEIAVGEKLYLWFNENPDTGLWIIDSSDSDVMAASVPGNDNIVVEGVSGGEALLRATLKENPKLVVSLKVVVHDADNPFSLESKRAEVQWPDDEWTYSGQAIEPVPVVQFTYGYGKKAHTETLEPGVDYTVEYADNIAAGTAAATVVGCGKFAGSLEHSFEIGRASLADAEVSATGWSWDGAVHDPDVRVSLGGKAVEAEGNWSYEVSKGDAGGEIAAADSVLDIGDYTVVVTGQGNYEGIAAGKFVVEKGHVLLTDATVRLSQDSFTYDGTAHVPSVVSVALPGGLTLQDGDYTVAYADNVEAGIATVTVTGQGNYTGSVACAFSISRASLAGATVKLSQSSYVYDGEAHTPAVVSVTLPSGVGVASAGYAVSYANNIETGTATVTVTGRGNFTGSASCAFKIVHCVTAASFADFDADAWYLRESPGEGAFAGEGATSTLYIDYIVANGIMSGYADDSGKFGVNDRMTRGQLVTVLYRAATGKTAQTTDNSVRPRFADTPANMYYSAAVKWASENDIVKGYDDGSGRFGPDDYVTREQMATIVYRYVAFSGADASPSADLSGYSDWRTVSDWASRAMSYCVAVSAMGYGGTTLNPHDTAPRIQAAKVVAVILHDIVNAT